MRLRAIDIHGESDPCLASFPVRLLRKRHDAFSRQYHRGTPPGEYISRPPPASFRVSPWRAKRAGLPTRVDGLIFPLPKFWHSLFLEV